MNKKGDLSIQFIVMAALALIVLIIIAVYFMGGMKTLLGRQAETVQLTEQQKSIWRSQCNLFCSMGQVDGFCNQVFQYDTDKDGNIDEVWVCNSNLFIGGPLPTGAEEEDLGVECNSIKKEGDTCVPVEAEEEE